jgi:hypothetical protein
MAIQAWTNRGQTAERRCRTSPAGTRFQGALNGQRTTPASMFMTGFYHECVGSELALGEVDRDRITHYYALLHLVASGSASPIQQLSIRPQPISAHAISKPTH